MTRPITAGTGAWPALPGAGWPTTPGLGTPGDRSGFPHPSTFQSHPDSHPDAPVDSRLAPDGGATHAAGLHLLAPTEAGAASGFARAVVTSGPVVPGRLVVDGQSVCRGLLRPLAGEGLVAFARDQAPARGLVAALAPGQVALVMLGDNAIAMGVEEMPLEDLPGLLRQRLREFSDLEHSPGRSGRRYGAEPARWALGLDMGHWNSSDRALVAKLSDEFRLGVQDLPQGVWVVDQLGGLHPRWPSEVQFEPQAA